MPLMEASGTKVDRMRPDRLNIWIAPVRNCDSMSVSPPSWLLGKIWMSTRPPDCARMRSTASRNRTFIGCCATLLLA